MSKDTLWEDLCLLKRLQEHLNKVDELVDEVDRKWGITLHRLAVYEAGQLSLRRAIELVQELIEKKVKERNEQRNQETLD